MNIFSERLKNALSERGMKQTELSERTGISKSSISEWLNGRYEAKADKIVLIAKALNVNESYLIGLDVPMENEVEQSSTKTILDNIFNKLEKPRQEIVINTAQEQLDEQNKEKTIKLFPYNVQEKLSAGTGYGYFDDGNSDTVYYDKQYDYDFASWIFGDSMLPDYPNGDVALIKACPFEYDGCVYAVDWDGQSYIKKVYKEEKGLRLVSTNEKYSDKFAPFTEEPRIIGKVVASFTPLEK
ncbi:LexA family transcriptional regulator [Lactococcus piscium]|uniref:Phage repressor protein n=1 Tax=Pseudolactococcus piscium MKFS47 TaxID=297352 RepID=A0A0D6DZ07_9LACT|nr:XRE family transcriptional regulator [Lactococcus piscium]CEN29177.1 Phage repressor protein [Lactococcus piscium MKFS47]